MSRRTLLLLCFVYCILVIAYAVITPKLFSPAPFHPADFGQMFGAFAAFFTGLGFLGVIYTVYLQTKQVENQSVEIRLQSKALEQTQQELQRATQAQATFERQLANQVHLAAISARLSATQLLIKDEVNHLKFIILTDWVRTIQTR